jgi:hypothetical protein
MIDDFGDMAVADRCPAPNTNIRTGRYLYDNV